MMGALIRRVEILAAEKRREQVRRLAARMQELVGDESVETIDGRIVVSGRGILKRWLNDPALRFFSSGLK
jgi:hypothetical protein